MKPSSFLSLAAFGVFGVYLDERNVVGMFARIALKEFCDRHLRFLQLQ